MRIMSGETAADMDKKNLKKILLHTECRDTEGDSRGKLDEEHIEGVEEGFMAMYVWVLYFEVIHCIRKHWPKIFKRNAINKDPPVIHRYTCERICAYQGMRKAAATLTPAATATKYEMTRLLLMQTIRIMKGTAHYRKRQRVVRRSIKTCHDSSLNN